jgi:hypothetical protein
MNEAGITYNRAMGAVLQKYKLDHMDKGDRFRHDVRFTPNSGH